MCVFIFLSVIFQCVDHCTRQKVQQTYKFYYYRLICMPALFAYTFTDISIPKSAKGSKRF